MTKKLLCKLGFHDWKIDRTERILFTNGIVRVHNSVTCNNCKIHTLKTHSEKIYGKI